MFLKSYGTPEGKFKLVILLWILACLFSWHFNYSHDALNNYRIFIGVFKHLATGTNLYAEYPAEYGDTNHYGPLFAMLIAPFSYLPISIGSLLWVLFNGALLIYAVWLLPISVKQRTLLLLLSSLEFANTTHSSQSNCIITALIILSFVLIEKGKDEGATALIVFGAFIKIYPIMALLFFVFSKRKKAFILSALLWTVILFVLPMIISGPHFVLQSYVDWYYSLIVKNASNRELGASINYSILGVIDAFTGNTSTSNALVIAIGLLILAAPLLRLSQYNQQRFRLYYLSSVLLFVVLFSTSSEHPTYIIAVIGAFLWMVQMPDLFTKKYTWLIVALIVLTGLGPTDAMPAYIREHFIDFYAVKAWPCIIVWLMISRRLLQQEFSNSYTNTVNKMNGEMALTPVQSKDYRRH